MLRVEFKGQPYDWFNLDEMVDVVRSDDFVNTLRENIVHYFSVPYDSQAIYDEEGILSTSIDFARTLKSMRPCIKVWDVREMPQDVRERTAQKLAVVAAEVARSQRLLSAFPGRTGGSRPVSPWPQRAPQAVEAEEPCAYMADRLILNGTPPPPMPPMHCGVSQQLLPGGMVAPSMLQGGSCGSWVPPATAVGAPGLPTMMGGVPQGMPPQGLAQMLHMQPLPTRPMQQPQQLPQQQLPQVPPMPQMPHMGQIPIEAMATMPGSAQALRHHDVGMLWPSWQDCMEVTLTKDPTDSKGSRFGFANIPSPDGRQLVITWVDANGLLGRWNRCYPDKVVHEGDMILMVNNVSDDVEALRIQLQQDTVRMVVHRTSMGQAVLPA